VAEHTDVDDCWIIYEGGVYDLTEYVRIHAGADATEHYLKQMHSEVADNILKSMFIGKLKEEENHKPN
jgi:cytochrome b involved in lipid metabolism